VTPLPPDCVGPPPEAFALPPVVVLGAAGTAAASRLDEGAVARGVEWTTGTLARALALAPAVAAGVAGAAPTAATGVRALGSLAGALSGGGAGTGAR
jgi:hypothetical protein